jgi:hypothetical protein
MANIYCYYLLGAMRALGVICFVLECGRLRGALSDRAPRVAKSFSLLLTIVSRDPPEKRVSDRRRASKNPLFASIPHADAALRAGDLAGSPLRQ